MGGNECVKSLVTASSDPTNDTATNPVNLTQGANLLAVLHDVEACTDSIVQAVWERVHKATMTPTSAVKSIRSTGQYPPAYDTLGVVTPPDGGDYYDDYDYDGDDDGQLFNLFILPDFQSRLIQATADIAGNKVSEFIIRNMGNMGGSYRAPRNQKRKCKNNKNNSASRKRSQSRGESYRVRSRFIVCVSLWDFVQFFA